MTWRGRAQRGEAPVFASRTIATARLYASVLWLCACVLFDGVRETLPDDERTAGAFLSGMCYAFVLFWGMLIFVTWLWSVSR